MTQFEIIFHFIKTLIHLERKDTINNNIFLPQYSTIQHLGKRYNHSLSIEIIKINK